MKIFSVTLKKDTLKKIEYYLEKEFQSLSGVLKIILFLIIFKFIYALTLSQVYPHPTSCMHGPLDLHPVLYVLFVVIIGPVTEEYIFRYPLYWLYEKTYSFKITIFVAVLLSIGFGLLHGSSWHIFVQGIAGFLYCLLFLKAGGMHDEPDIGIKVTIFAHASFNAICVFLEKFF